MQIIALTGRAGSGKDTAAIGIRILTGSLDPTWMAPKATRGNSMEIDWPEVFNAYWPNQSTNPDNQWKVLKFAEPVYQIAAILTGHDLDEDLMNDEFKNSIWDIGNDGYTGRQILQLVGTEMGRTIFNTEIWIKLMDRKLESLKLEGYKGAIITDCRFLNEADYLRRKWNAPTIKMTGRNSGVLQNHASESELENIGHDYICANSGSYNDLMTDVDYICRQIGISNHKYTWK